MSRTGIRDHIRSNVVGYVAIFLFAAGGTAYATHPGGLDTISSDDIINGAVKSADVGNDSLESQDVRDETSPGGGLQSQDLRPGSVGASETIDGSLTGADVADTGSLGTAEINEDSLFNDDSLDATDVSDKSTLGTAEIDEASLFNDNSLDAADVSNGSTLGSSEINEAGLSQVPNAARASEATTLRFQHVQELQFAANNGSGAQGFANPGDLSLDSVCDSATGDLSLVASTDVNNASLAVSDDDAYFDVEDFDIADGDVDILGPLGGDSDEVINLVYVNGSGFGINDVVTAQLHVLDQAPTGTQSECIVAGHVFNSKRT
jgi:hypothetical protein